MCAHSIVHVLVSQQWTVLNNPQPSGAFYSPWFGMDPADNLNLIQVSTHQQATHTHTTMPCNLLHLPFVRSL